jgi:1-acyl-sn-glycerol-3-phosphate acyltransferase
MIRALLLCVLMPLNLLFWGVPVFAVAALKLLAPTPAFRAGAILTAAGLAERWVAWNSWLMDHLLDTRWEVTGLPDDLRHDGRYLIISNHVSWIDILALFRAFHRRTPLIRFFIKSSLIWLPVVGQCGWALEFPFMRRYSAEYLARHPEKRGKDLETTREACRRFRAVPVSILNFAEGTRITPQKHAQQNPPYRHLLAPRPGGTGFVLSALGDQLDGVLDATIAYPGRHHGTTMADFVMNRFPRVTVHVRRLDVPAEFATEAISEPGPARDRFKAWLEKIWREKDDLLESMLREEESARRADAARTH